MNHLDCITSAEARYGSIFYFVDDDPIGKALEYYGEWAQAEIDLLLTFIGVGSTVVDIGANVGTHTLAFARHVGPRGSVHAFEPQRPVFVLLERNIAENGLLNVYAHCAGIGRTVGEMLVPPLDYTSHVNVGAVALASAVDGNEGQPVSIVTIDTLNLPACDLVKIDAEGMEDAVLEGMADTIRRWRPVIYGECTTVDAGAAFLRAIDRTGYRIFLTRTAAFNPDNYRQKADNFFGVARESSLLCVPETLRAYSPTSSPLVDVMPVSDLQSLAEALLSTPRYGDATSFDRDPSRLREAVEAGAEEVKRLTFRIAGLEKQIQRDTAALLERDAVNAELEVAHAEEVKRLTAHIASLEKQIEGAAAALVQRDVARAELDAFHASTSWRITRPLRLIKTATIRRNS